MNRVIKLTIISGLIGIALKVVMIGIGHGMPTTSLDKQGIDTIVSVYHKHGLFWLWLVVGLGAPIFEELCFRGSVPKIAKWLKLSAPVGIVLAAGLWAAGHPTSWVKVVFTFFEGVNLGILREKTGSLWPSIFLHVANNSAAILMVPYALKHSGG